MATPRFQLRAGRTLYLRFGEATMDRLLVSICGVATSAIAAFAADPLPSWNDTAAKQAIVEFVEKVTKQGSPDFVPIAERIATFDNDGTLWAEQPMYFQFLFARRSREGIGAAASGMEDQGAVCVATQGRHEGRAGWWRARSWRKWSWRRTRA